MFGKAHFFLSFINVALGYFGDSVFFASSSAQYSFFNFTRDFEVSFIIFIFTIKINNYFSYNILYNISSFILNFYNIISYKIIFTFFINL